MDMRIMPVLESPSGGIPQAWQNRKTSCSSPSQPVAGVCDSTNSMKLATSFESTFFPQHIIREAMETLFETRNLETGLNHLLSLNIGANTWTYNTIEEFFGDFAKRTGRMYVAIYNDNRHLNITLTSGDTEIAIEAEAHAPINATLSVFQRAADTCKLPKPPIPVEAKIPPIIFIGHGHSLLWRDLKDHLTEKHGYQVIAYEVGARAGHTIRDILEEMLRKSSFACLILTAEDETGDGKMRARQNIIHETGLFQGRLGFSRAIVLLEEGAEDFSNMNGIQRIRFASGNIKETYGEVLATLRREFGDQK